jgi:hypothetical protein
MEVSVGRQVGEYPITAMALDGTRTIRMIHFTVVHGVTDQTTTEIHTLVITEVLIPPRTLSTWIRITGYAVGEEIHDLQPVVDMLLQAPE